METFDFIFGDDPRSIAWWQMCNRAALIFVYAVALYRLMPRKAFGGMAALDIVVTVIMGSSLSRALTANAELIPALAATAVLAALHLAFSWATPRSDTLSRFTKGRPHLLIKDGKVDWQAMHRAQLGERDLTEGLRLKGVSAVDEVSEAYLERNGTISVIRSRD